VGSGMVGGEEEGGLDRMYHGGLGNEGIERLDRESDFGRAGTQSNHTRAYS
jgi:hypothetical protein